MAEDITAKEQANDRITSGEAKSEYLTVFAQPLQGNSLIWLKLVLVRVIIG